MLFENHTDKENAKAVAWLMTCSAPLPPCTARGGIEWRWEGALESDDTHPVSLSLLAINTLNSFATKCYDDQPESDC